MKQSIVPVVAWREGDDFIRCIGTGSVISCSGYVMTAAHILMDPFDSGYGATRQANQMVFAETLNFGVIVPYSPAYGTRGFRYFSFQKYWLWGHWKESPLVYEKDRFEYSTDIAICKIAEMPHGAAHQPLSLSLNPFIPGEAAYSLGYAEMNDIPLDYGKGGMVIKEFEMDLFVSVGEVMRVFPENHLQKDVSTPGPCFDFNAKIPGKMSGAPIFGAQGAVIRGAVSRSFSGERHAFGAMLGPAMHLPLDEPQITGRTLRTLMDTGNEGMAQVQGAGL
ncbi:trypsin-like peptidase domain-containing protein [Mesorhizobium sp. M0185]|uniref:trypsin-like peptidase domain-containing protein n=2 Tax=unclassified Mesorhizobium TaxID=325217 RepID=UPI003336664D